MIEIINLSKKYGNNAILENVSCSLENQRIYALVGVNGIGKSTLLNAVTQPANIDSGKVEVDGINSQKYESKFHFFYVPDSKEMFLNLTGNEYLKCIIQLYSQDAVKSDETLKKLSIAFKLDIREKIEDDPAHLVYIQTVWGVGYKFNGRAGSD